LGRRELEGGVIPFLEGLGKKGFNPGQNYLTFGGKLGVKKRAFLNTPRRKGELRFIGPNWVFPISFSGEPNY